MTAIVGILNKGAIAADSAASVSVNNESKIFNKSTKIFTISKFHPVGVMIHNQSSFLSTPWETIIKVYRKQLKDKSFATLAEYQQDFIAYLHSKDFFSDDFTIKSSLYWFFYRIIDLLNNSALQGNEHLIKAPVDPSNIPEVVKLVAEKYDEHVISIRANSDFYDELISLTQAEFDTYTKDIFNELVKEFYEKNGITDISSFEVNLKEILFLSLKQKEEWSGYTGLVFVGFGEEEIYPSVIPLIISLAFEKRLRYFIDTRQEIHISNSNSSGIARFGQIDVIDTILTGVDYNLESTFLNNFESLVQKYHGEIQKIVSSDPALEAQIKAVDIQTIVKEFTDKIQKHKQESYIDRLFSAMHNLSKEDLAEMAESLIYLTYLKRRITFAEESVGGPVDVAIISKGDGFIWIKRKLYFKPELNAYFFDNYLK